jgi:ribosomal protein S12 methylthiotransferase accessory factor
VPAALCLRDVGEGERTGMSLGCAAGVTPMAATRSALLELIERDAVALWWRGDLPAGLLPDETLRLGGAEGMLRGMRQDRAERRTWFLDLTTDLGVPVVAAVSARHDGSDMAFGFAARETLAGCLRPALCELAQMEFGNWLVRFKIDRGGETALSEHERRQQERISILSAGMKTFNGDGLLKGHVLEAAEDDAASTRRIVDRLSALGMSAHLVDLTDPGLGVPVVKVVAPGLQAEPSGFETERLKRCRARFGTAENTALRPDIL